MLFLARSDQEKRGKLSNVVCAGGRGRDVAHYPAPEGAAILVAGHIDRSFCGGWAGGMEWEKGGMDLYARHR